jgi:hypothetical protein
MNLWLISDRHRYCTYLYYSWEARTGPRQTQTCSYTPDTARLHRGSPLMTLQPTKQQPATICVVERGGRVTTVRQTKRRRGQPQVTAPRPHTHAGDALRQLTMHISTNDLHCCKPARLLQQAPSGGHPQRRPPATAPPRINPLLTEPNHRASRAKPGP